MSDARLKVLLAMVAVLAIWSYRWFTRAPPERCPELRRILHHVTNSVDPHALQRWAFTYRAEQQATNSTGAGHPLSAVVPTSLRHIPTLGYLGPMIAIESVEDRQIVELVFLGGFGSWGISIGDEDYVIPSDRHDDRRLEWIPGVYVIISP